MPLSVDGFELEGPALVGTAVVSVGDCELAVVLSLPTVVGVELTTAGVVSPEAVVASVLISGVVPPETVVAAGVVSLGADVPVVGAEVTADVLSPLEVVVVVGAPVLAVVCDRINS